MEKTIQKQLTTYIILYVLKQTKPNTLIEPNMLENIWATNKNPPTFHYTG